MTICNGNCKQGRACDCLPDVDLGDEPEHIRAVKGLIVAIVITAACAAFGLLLSMVWRAPV